MLLNETAALFAAEFGCEVSSCVDKRNASRPLPELKERARVAFEQGVPTLCDGT